MKRVALTFDDDYNIEPYADALRAVNVEPLLVTPTRPLSSFAELDGLLVSGGNDVDPSLYGQQPQPQTEAPIKERDQLESRLLLEALRADLPVLAICRGMQLLNVLHPHGTLSQHIEGHVRRPQDASLPAHDVSVVEGSRLARILGPGDHPVNSRHHQAVAKVGEGLVVSAHSQTDGVIEGLEIPGRRFVVAVQWHPENQVHRFAAQRNLFLAFADAL